MTEKKTGRAARRPTDERDREGASPEAGSGAGETDGAGTAAADAREVGEGGAPTPGTEEAKAPPTEETLRLQAADLADKWLRAVADLENYKKRAARDRERDLWNARAGVTLALLDVLDDLERALGDDKADPEAFRKGIALIREKFLAGLERIGVTPFDSIGEAFDPEKHDALQRIPSAEVREGCVAAEIRRGYSSGDRVLRHALVAVAMAPSDDKNDT